MRFLFECVGCCRTDRTISRSMSLESTSPNSGVEESRTLFAPGTVSSAGSRGSAGRTLRRNKRLGGGGGRRGRGAGGRGEWKPSLFAISEDHSVPPSVGGSSRSSHGGLVVDSVRNIGGKRCAVVSVASVTRSSGRTDYHGQEAMPMVIPAFAPAPFMF